MREALTLMKIPAVLNEEIHTFAIPSPTVEYLDLVAAPLGYHLLETVSADASWPVKSAMSIAIVVYDKKVCV